MLKPRGLDIAMVVAMKTEADKLAAKLGLVPQAIAGLPFLKYSNADRSVGLFTPGVDARFTFLEEPISRIGKVPIALVAASLLVLSEPPKCVVNLGTAGGGKKTKIGDIILATGAKQRDAHIPLGGDEGYAGYGNRIINASRLPVKLVQKLGIDGRGIVSTGDSFALALEKGNIIAYDMELFAMMEALEIYGYGGLVIAFKAITDLVDNDKNHNDFAVNFGLAMNNLSDFTAKLISNKNQLLLQK